MMNASQASQRNIFLTAALAVFVLGWFSALEAPHYTYTGYSRSGGRVVNVDDGSPAAAAGLRPGDELDSVNGIPLRSIGDLEHRPTAGEIWRLVVRRNGAILTLQLFPTGQPALEVVRARSRSILGLCLVGFTVWAFITSPSKATMLLAVAGLSFGFLALGTPYFAPGIVRQALDATAVLAVTIGMVVVVHFLLVFPSRGRLLERPWAPWFLYAPAVAVAIPSIGNIVLPPTLKVDIRLLGTLWTVLSLAYFLWATALLVQRYVATPRAERSKHGLGLMLGGTFAVVVPFLFFAVVAIVPGLWPASARAYQAYSPYAAATFSIVPLAFSVAAVRCARSSRTSGDTSL